MELAPTHIRLAELWFEHMYGCGLDDEEHQELSHCMDWHMRLVQKYQQLCNLSFMAHLSNDTDWQHDICLRIDILLTSGREG